MSVAPTFAADEIEADEVLDLNELPAGVRKATPAIVARANAAATDRKVRRVTPLEGETGPAYAERAEEEIAVIKRLVFQMDVKPLLTVKRTIHSGWYYWQVMERSAREITPQHLANMKAGRAKAAAKKEAAKKAAEAAAKSAGKPDAASR